MEAAVGAARWVVGKALGAVTDGLLESWAASSELGLNVRALKMELLYAQGMLDNARGRDAARSPALGYMLLELRDLAFRADDVLDELEYFRIQDQLDGTYETAADAGGRGLIAGLILNARHTAKAVASKINCSSYCSSAAVICTDSDGEGDQDATKGCTCLPIGSWSSKARQGEPSVHVPKLKFDRVELSKRMADIVEQLKPVCAKVATILDMELLGSAIRKLDLLGPDGMGTTTHHSATWNRPRTSTPQIIQSKLYGREHLKWEVVHDITRGKHGASELTVHSIVGPGGIGKTTFTQHIYQEVSNWFQIKIWICVSQDFNATRLVKEIVTKIPGGDNEKENATDEELIQTRLQSKRLLLILDDLWACAEDEWQRLLAPLRKGGTQGNVVIVTTRIPKVAAMVAARYGLTRLERLDNEDCMGLFQACVFGDQQSWEDHTDLHSVGWEIVKRLKGFPLAVKTVGRLLRNNLTSDHWRRVLESKEWELQSNDDDDIMPALKLSYNYLCFDVQQCFSCCALFPEDYEFDREELIHFWIGFGLLGTSNQNKRVEDIGLDHINELVDHGFLEKGEKEDGHIYYTVHDLLHELALNISSYECLSINGVSNVRSAQVPPSIRHLSIIVKNTDMKDRKTFENCKSDLRVLGARIKAENLRTLMLFGEYHGNFSKTFSDLFGKAKYLRVLFLSGVTYNMEDLLPTFSEFVHLRYLRIKGHMYPAATLPHYISRFYQLLVLDLRQCRSLFPFVRELRNLVKIRHFLVKDEKFHSEISEVGELKHLQGLRTFEVKKDLNGFELKQLGQLQELQGSLRICNLERVEEMMEADEANILHMKHLNQLVLEWGANRSNKDPKKEEDVLESLKPNSNVREICIRGHGGTTCPTWLGADLCVKGLESLELEGLAWKILPPLGELWMVDENGDDYLSCMTGQSFQHLKRIELVGIPLRKWRGNGTQLFPVLEVLTVSGCNELIELPLLHFTSCPAEQEKTVTMFPKLREINISDCANLVSLPPIPWTDALSSAVISQVGGIDMLVYKKSIKEVFVNMGNDALDSGLWKNMLAFKNMSEIECLQIIDCPPVPLHEMQMLASLNRLNIFRCSNVLLSVEGETNARHTFPVEHLSFHQCGATGKELTTFLSYFPNLWNLALHRCERVTGLGVAEKQETMAMPEPWPIASDDKTVGQHQQTQGRGEEEIKAQVEGLLLLPPQIQELELDSCPDLRLCSGSLDEGLASLRRLMISDCCNFLSSSSSSSFSNCPFPSSLQTLYLSNIDGIFSLHPLPNLTNLQILDCGDLRGKVLWPLLAQGHVTQLTIHSCPNIFVASEPSQQDEQDFLHSCRLQMLCTDGKDGILAVPICAHLCSSLTKLYFGWNDDIESFTTEQEQDLQKLTSLQELEISYCYKLQSLPAKLSVLPKLKRLEIKECPAIQSFPKDGLPNSLTILLISECPSIRSLPKGRFPSSLQTLDVSNSGNNELRKQCRKFQGTIPVIKA